MSFNCSTCNRSFTRKNNLVRHLKRKYCSIPVPTSKKSENEQFTCAKCNASFTTKSNCARHINKGKCLLSKKRTSLSTKVTTSKNEKDVNATTSHFENYADFLLWKDNEEQKTLSKYSQDSGMKKTKTGNKIRYVCHRAGKVRERLKKPSSRKRRLKSKGSCKINNRCTAYMLYRENFDGKVTVLYNPNHSNHELEIKHVPISLVEKSNIADKLRDGAPLDQVLDEIRDTLDDTRYTRTHLITKHELHNIIKEKNIQYVKRKSLVDNGSVESIIEEYRTKFGTNTPFKYYKEQGEKKDQFDENDFLLVIMNSMQIALMKKFGSIKVCVDSTHATDNYDFYLNTVLVMDDLNMAVPVAHAISNKENIVFVTKFFEVIKQECGVIRTNTFMCDDFSEYANAWTTVMGGPKNILLCPWYVDKNWRNNLNLVTGSKALKDETHKILRTVMDEKNEASFPQIVTSAVQNLMDNPNTTEFGKYFQHEYSQRYELWAFAFRKFIGLNTNKILEVVHKELMKVYSHGLKTKRLDMLITALLRMNRNKAFDRVSHSITETDSHMLKKVQGSSPKW